MPNDKPTTGGSFARAVDVGVGVGALLELIALVILMVAWLAKDAPRTGAIAGLCFAGAGLVLLWTALLWGADLSLMRAEWRNVLTLFTGTAAIAGGLGVGLVITWWAGLIVGALMSVPLIVAVTRDSM